MSHPPVPQGFHDLPTPTEPFQVAPPGSPWPATVWLVLWSDGDVTLHDTEEQARQEAADWTEERPMHIGRGPTWVVDVREVRT